MDLMFIYENWQTAMMIASIRSWDRRGSEQSGSLRHPSGRRERERERERERGRSGGGGVSQVGSIDSDGGGGICMGWLRRLQST